jgi:hypothetical protein
MKCVSTCRLLDARADAGGFAKKNDESGEPPSSAPFQSLTLDGESDMNPARADAISSAMSVEDLDGQQA